MSFNLPDYKYKKDEIFKRMKVTTLVQLVCTFCRLPVICYQIEKAVPGSKIVMCSCTVKVLWKMQGDWGERSHLSYFCLACFIFATSTLSKSLAYAVFSQTKLLVSWLLHHSNKRETFPHGLLLSTSISSVLYNQILCITSNLHSRVPRSWYYTVVWSCTEDLTLIKSNHFYCAAHEGYAQLKN